MASGVQLYFMVLLLGCRDLRPGKRFTGAWLVWQRLIRRWFLFGWSFFRWNLCWRGFLVERWLFTARQLLNWSLLATGVLTAWKWLFFRCWQDRKSTRLNSSHVSISYAVFCLMTRPPLVSTLFPYTTLFRSGMAEADPQVVPLRVELLPVEPLLEGLPGRTVVVHRQAIAQLELARHRGTHCLEVVVLPVLAVGGDRSLGHGVLDSAHRP